MRRIILTGAVILVLTIALLTGLTGCFLSSNNSSKDTTTPTVVKPAPEVVSVVATTSGTHSAYYTTLDIKVKNSGAEGTILVKATVIQNGKNSYNEMEVFLKQNESHELKLTFPLVWQGGDFTSNVETIVP
jgi:ABC-type glycerol-3-phosphate transport system substrate-binding protein